MSLSEFRGIRKEELEGMDKDDLLHFLAKLISVTDIYINQTTSQIAREQTEAYHLLAENLQNKLEIEFKEKLELEKIRFSERIKDILKKKLDDHYSDSLRREALNIKLFYERKSNQKNKERLKVMSKLYNQVYVQEQVLMKSVDFAKHLLQCALLLVAIDELSDALRNHEPIKNHIQRISEMKIDSENDFLVSTLNSFSPRVVEKGTVPDVILSRKLKKDSKVCRRLALIPENSGPFWHIYSHFINFFLTRSVGLVDGNSVDSILSRTQFYVDNGKLGEALRQIQPLVVKQEDDSNNESSIVYNQVISEITNPWYIDVQDRLESQQLSSVLRTYAISSILQMTNF